MWIVAAIAFVSSVWSVVAMATFPSALARDPVRANGEVTSTFINGFGGDPAVNYRYAVNNHVYSGWGTGDGINHGNLLSLKRGALITIRYARTDPSKSCFCDPAAESASVGRYAFASAFALPLPLLGARYVRRRRNRKDSASRKTRTS
ncbi:MAG: hypothetical protein QOK28_3547 [Actinomycetota bacterium]|jgi:hypothetical protein